MNGPQQTMSTIFLHLAKTKGNKETQSKNQDKIEIKAMQIMQKMKNTINFF